MNRRSFFRRVGAAIAGAALSTKLGVLLPPPPAIQSPKLVFHQDAFKLVMAPTRPDIIYGWAWITKPEYAMTVRVE